MNASICPLSSFVISINWLPSSYASPEGSFLIQATFDMAFIGLDVVGKVISNTRRHARDINSLDLKRTPPSLILVLKDPVGRAMAFLRFLYWTGRLDSTRGYLRFSS